MNPPLLLPEREGRILRASVRLARLLLDAHAASVFLASTLDALVLRATSEEDADHLLGITLAPNEGIAGWVFSDDQDFYRDPNMQINLSALQNNVDLLEKLGIIKSGIQVSQFSEPNLLNEALARLK